jgi:glutaredoxin
MNAYQELFLFVNLNLLIISTHSLQESAPRRAPFLPICCNRSQVVCNIEQAVLFNKATGHRHGSHTPTERIIQMPENKVKIFSLSTCSHCRSTKKLLDECTIKYDFVDVDLLEGDERKAILEDVKSFNPKCSFPTIIINDKVIVGFKENEIREALGI